ncbi:hypothetical protein SAMN04488104_10733 [Algoriphagus faecimaris]|uniref:Uncharacterized protein n=1 Tax=Algoriphagus faecimaris TaxID=686796 RepID=A0A1G6XYR8_9BACT|nr:hypothetical protein [Algoriphagus faecimaris]SDD83182.1 hypothetical protein SAMN04488104_10733 [Algoriphagus faecimaris]
MKKNVFELIKPLEFPTVTPLENTHYVIHDDFYQPVEKPTEKEREIAKKFLTLLNTSEENQDELVLTLTSTELYNFLIHLQREIKGID